MAAYIFNKETNAIIQSTVNIDPEELKKGFIKDNPDGMEPTVSLFGGASLSLPEENA